MSGVFEEFALEINKETALRMLEAGKLSFDEIALYANLSVAEVQALAAQKRIGVG